MKYIKLCLFIALVLSLNSCNDFKRHREMLRILSEVAKDKRAESSVVGNSASESEQWKKIDSVMNIATLPELIHICCDHPSPTVRMAMFMHITDKYPHEAVQIALRKINDFDMVRTIAGCEERISPLSCARYAELHSYEDFNKRFTNEERESLEKAMVQSPHFEYFAESCGWIVDSIKPKPEYYQFFKDNYNKTKHNKVLFTILKYNNPIDKLLIADKLKQINKDLNNSNYPIEEARNRDEILDWVIEHPENEFEPYIKQIMTMLFKLNTDEIIKAKKNNQIVIASEYHIGYTELYALLAYKKKWAYDLLEAKIKEDIEEVTMDIHDESEYFKPLTDRIKAAYEKQWED